MLILAAIAEFLSNLDTNLPSKAGRKGPVDDRDLWYFEPGWSAHEAEADADLAHARYLDFADATSLITVLQSPPDGPHSQPFINAIRAAQAPIR